MRAGGVKGMYQVGVLQSLYDNLPKEEVAYDVTTGASIGAVNAATIGMFAKGNETEAYKVLYDDWADLTTDQIFAEWPTFGPLAGFWKPSFFDDTPTHTRINTRLLNPFKRMVAFQTVNIDDGKIYTFDEKFNKSLQGESVAASASIPTMFQPTTTIGNMHLVDGGTYSYMNLQAAILKCREVADSDENITVDVILDQDKPVEMKNFKGRKYFNAYHIYKRQSDFAAYYSIMDDLFPIVEQNPKINFRYIISPTEPLPGNVVPIWVNPKDLNQTYEIGYNDAIKAMKNDTVYKEFHDQTKDYAYFTLREGFD